MTHNVYTQLDTLGISLPPVAVPAAAYVPFVQTGKTVFLSGHSLYRKKLSWYLRKNRVGLDEKGTALSDTQNTFATPNAAGTGAHGF